MLKGMKRCIGMSMAAACLIVIAGCFAKQSAQSSAVTPEVPLREHETEIAFDVDVMDSYWTAYKSEFLNEAGNISRDGRGMDEWTQTLSLNIDGTAAWLEFDLESFETTNACFGTYEIKNHKIILKADEEIDDSTVDKLTFEMLDGNELKLEYPKNNFVYFKYEDLSNWSSDYITREQLVDYLWTATSKTVCEDACETEAIDEDAYYESVTFYDDDSVYWYAYDLVNDDVLDEMLGYWYFEGSNIVISKNKNPDDNGPEDMQYFRYSDGMIHRIAAADLEYHFTIYGDWNAGLMEESDFYNTYWVIQSQTILNTDSFETKVIEYPDQNNTIVDLYLYEDGTAVYSCRNDVSGDIYWTVEVKWSLDGTELTLEKSEDTSNPYDIALPVVFYTGENTLSNITESEGSGLVTTEVFVMES